MGAQPRELEHNSHDYSARLAVELLNEVADCAVRDYLRRGYEVVRQAAGDNVVVVIGDAFEVLTCVLSPQNYRLRLKN
jgi:hypothetical protein